MRINPERERKRKKEESEWVNDSWIVNNGISFFDTFRFSSSHFLSFFSHFLSLSLSNLSHIPWYPLCILIGFILYVSNYIALIQFSFFFFLLLLPPYLWISSCNENVKEDSPIRGMEQKSSFQSERFRRESRKRERRIKR